MLGDGDGCWPPSSAVLLELSPLPVGVVFSSVGVAFSTVGAVFSTVGVALSRVGVTSSTESSLLVLAAVLVSGFYIYKYKNH